MLTTTPTRGVGGGSPAATLSSPGEQRGADTAPGPGAPRSAGTTDEAANADEAWNIMDDLEFLIATDDVLHDEFSHVCDLLDDSFPIDDILPTDLAAEAMSDTTSNDASSPLSNASAQVQPTLPRTTRKRVNHQKEEIRYLQKQVVALQAKLAHDKKRASIAAPFNMSAWEAAARQERVEKRRAVIENDQLRESIVEGSMFIHQMQSMMRKKPRWATTMTDAGVADWQEYKVAAHATLRAAAIHAIADRQFRRQTNAFILAQVVGQTDELFRASPKTLLSGQVVLEVVNHTTLKLPHRIAMSAIWRTFRGDLGPMLLDDACTETMENIDEFTRYERFSQRRRSLSGDKPPTESTGSAASRHAPSIAFTNTIIKLFQERDRDVLVFRSVLEDELEPHMTRRAVDDMAGWLVTLADPTDPNKCGLTSVIHMPLDAKPTEATSEVADLVQALECFSFGPKSAAQAPPVPGRDAFFQRAKQFDNAMKVALQTAATEFYGAAAPS